MASNKDEAHLRRALRLAARGRYHTAPNPRVGAVLVRDGVVVGEGWHRRAGEPHAESEALAAAGDRARGATLYSNLEPCCHQGRTPPCTDALLAAGVVKVVASHRDPDPRVSGRGFARLREAGVEVEVGALAREAAALNLPFLTAKTLGRPAVTLKWAMSLDGKIATASGESKWISSEAGRRWALALREEHDAILVGSGTALADDPLLTRRLGRAEGPILRVVLDRRLRLPPAAKMLGEEGEVVVFTESEDAERWAALATRGARVERLDQVDPASVLAALQARGVQSLLVEGGAEVHAAFVATALWDRLEVECAPLLIGGRDAPGPIGGEGIAALAAAPRLESLSVRRRGQDVILSGFRQGALDELLRQLTNVQQTEVSLRDFGEADRPRLDEWARRIDSATYMSRYAPKAEECLLWCVIEADGADVGTVWLEKAAEPDEANLGILLGDPFLFGQGIGKRAIALAIAEARRRAPLRVVRLHVRVDNARAIACYEHCGFRVVGSSTREAGGRKYGIFGMEKRLSSESAGPADPPR